MEMEMEMELIGQIGIIPDPDREGSTPVLKRGVVMVAAEGFEPPTKGL
jgi:hypothetical protein